MSENSSNLRILKLMGADYVDWQNDPLNVMPLFQRLGIKNLKDDLLDKAAGYRIGSWFYMAAKRIDSQGHL